MGLPNEKEVNPMEEAIVRYMTILTYSIELPNTSISFIALLLRNMSVQ